MRRPVLECTSGTGIGLPREAGCGGSSSVLMTLLTPAQAAHGTFAFGHRPSACLFGALLYVCLAAPTTHHRRCSGDRHWTRVVCVAGTQGDTRGSFLSLGTTKETALVSSEVIYMHHMPLTNLSVGSAGSDLARIWEISKEELRVMEVLEASPPPNLSTREPPRVLLNSRPSLQKASKRTQQCTGAINQCNHWTFF